MTILARLSEKGMIKTTAKNHFDDEILVKR